MGQATHALMGCGRACGVRGEGVAGASGMCQIPGHGLVGSGMEARTVE